MAKRRPSWRLGRSSANVSREEIYLSYHAHMFSKFIILHTDSFSVTEAISKHAKWACAFLESGLTAYSPLRSLAACKLPPILLRSTTRTQPQTRLGPKYLSSPGSASRSARASLLRAILPWTRSSNGAIMRPQHEVDAFRKQFPLVDPSYSTFLTKLPKEKTGRCCLPRIQSTLEHVLQKYPGEHLLSLLCYALST